MHHCSLLCACRLEHSLHTCVHDPATRCPRDCCPGTHLLTWCCTLRIWFAQNVLAKMVIERVPSVEMVRFVNSGTEACLSVVRLMRAYTGREKVRFDTVRRVVHLVVSRFL